LRKKREEIFELADLPLPKWQRETHLRFIRLERLRFPGLLKPIKRAVLDSIYEIKKDNRDLITLLSIGSGAMELERQVIEDLLKKNFKTPIIFLGVEISPEISDITFSNLSSLVDRKLIKIKKINYLNDQILNDLKTEAKSQRFLVVIFNKNTFDLKKGLSDNIIDIVYHSRAKHHFGPKEKDNLDKMATHLAPRVIEFDDFCSLPVFIFPSVITWLWPVTLNGAILSYLRDFSKKELLNLKKDNWKIKTYQLGYYLRIYEE
jgi:hypothetical protein